MKDITLYIHSLKNINTKDGYFTIRLSNDFYQIVIRYLQTDYQTHLKNKDFQSEDILIQCHTIKSGFPDILILLKSDGIEQRFGIEIPMEQTIILDDTLPDFIENTKIAASTLRQLKTVIEHYFPTILQS